MDFDFKQASIFKSIIEDIVAAQLKKQGIRLEDIFYCFYRNKKLYIIEKNKI